MAQTAVAVRLLSGENMLISPSTVPATIVTHKVRPRIRASTASASKNQSKGSAAVVVVGKAFAQCVDCRADSCRRAGKWRILTRQNHCGFGLGVNEGFQFRAKLIGTNDGDAPGR